MGTISMHRFVVALAAVAVAGAAVAAGAVAGGEPGIKIVKPR